MIAIFSNVPLSASEMRQLRMARAIGFAKAAIRRAVHLDDHSFLGEALDMLEAV